jgi:hypothetical protein
MRVHDYRHAPRGWQEKVAPATQKSAFVASVFARMIPKTQALVRTNAATQAKRKNRITLAPVSITKGPEKHD